MDIEEVKMMNDFHWLIMFIYIVWCAALKLGKCNIRVCAHCVLVSHFFNEKCGKRRMLR